MGDFREIIKRKRKQLGISQKELAKSVGIRNSTLSDYETGKSGLNPDKIEKIFEILKIKIELG